MVTFLPQAVKITSENGVKTLLYPRPPGDHLTHVLKTSVVLLSIHDIKCAEMNKGYLSVKHPVLMNIQKQKVLNLI